MIMIIQLLLVGFCVGGFGTLIGIGGGPLIVPFIILVYQLPPEKVVATSLFIIFFNVFSGTMSYYNQKRIDIITGTKFGIATIPGAIIGTFVPHFFTLRFFEILFALFLVALAAYIIHNMISEYYLKKYADHQMPVHSVPKDTGIDNTKKVCETKRILYDASGNKFEYSFNEKRGTIVSVFIGFIAPIMGIGGGIIHVPVMTKLLHFPVHIATATVHYQLLLCLFFALIPYILTNDIDFTIGIPMATGTVFGALVGAKISKRFSGSQLLGLLCVVLLFLALRLLLFQ